MNDYASELDQIESSGLSIRNKYLQLKQVLERCCKEITKNESLQFPSLFSRLVFISQKYNLPKRIEWQLQNIRVKASFLNSNENNVVATSQYEKAKNIISLFLSYINGDRHEIALASELDDEKNVAVDIHSFSKLRVQVVDIHRDDHILSCKSTVLFDEILKIKYNVANLNDTFNSTIEQLWIGAQLNLIDVKLDEYGYFTPHQFVLEPDYLIDASAMAECFQNYGSSHLHYFRRKFEPPRNSHYILLGNLANFFLDELIYADNPYELTFDEVFLNSFRQMPFEYTSCKDIAEDINFRIFMQKAREHFANIKRVVLHDMPANGFDVHKCTLEPSFFSEKYGFQGRLDLLQLPDDKDPYYRIIELKSGKPPFPQNDPTKIAPNHEAQTLVYRLLIQSVFEKQPRDIYPTILYSSAHNSGENIRLAAPYKQFEKELINARNLIVAKEHDLYTGGYEVAKNTFDQLFDIKNYGKTPAFFIDKLAEMEKVINESTDIERTYFYRFISFVTRELYLQKMGDEGFDSSMSTSALWNTTFKERKDALDLISNLEILAIDDSGKDMKIRFKRNETGDYVNFREGEICILYPHEKEEDTLLANQILKGTVLEISATHVVLRFRYKQRNRSYFERYTRWAVEHDKLDHSYNSMYKSLFSFLSAPQEKKNLLLGLVQPKSTYSQLAETDLSKDQKFRTVINKALAANDYYLIVGPPGTGKTSIFAKRLIQEFYAQPNTNILVMAYTNRAVDELCAAICDAFGENESECDKYIRIGTELSCGENYRHRLLQFIANDAKKRKDLTDEIGNKRIFVGTLASIVGKPELFEIKKFNVTIIDEASQILEAQLIGLLPQFEKFILIGDQKQLSTITLQNESKSKIEDKSLHQIGLYDCRESLFERLFRNCLHNGWTDAYDTLTFHGRMHNDIAKFVNDEFYDNVLRTATDRQHNVLEFLNIDTENAYHQLLASQRVVFIPVRENAYASTSDKMNQSEANKVVEITKSIYEFYKLNNKTFDPQTTMGIIAPYRNQLALIKQKLAETNIPELSLLMIDTVERFQGSQRDVIVVSFCFNQAYQMQFFSNMNREGNVDRKLNVALTRAREQLVLIGNDLILKQHPIYNKLLTSIRLF